MSKEEMKAIPAQEQHMQGVLLQRENHPGSSVRPVASRSWVQL